MNSALLIHQIYPPGKDPGFDLSQDYLDFCVKQNQPYCERHSFDYWHSIENLNPDGNTDLGSWTKVILIQRGLEAGYKFVVWLDVDTLIWRDEDLRNACIPEHIGVCWHRIPQLDHWNIGAMYLGNSESVRQFVKDWLSAYPGDKDGWAEQGAFNRMARKSEVVQTISDRWNATQDYSMVPDAVVLGFHGAGNPKERLEKMRQTMEAKRA